MSSYNFYYDHVTESFIDDIPLALQNEIPLNEIQNTLFKCSEIYDEGREIEN